MMNVKQNQPDRFVTHADNETSSQMQTLIHTHTHTHTHGMHTLSCDSFTKLSLYSSPQFFPSRALIKYVPDHFNILDDKRLTVWCWYTFGLLYFIADHPSPLFQKQTVEALFIQGGSKQDLLIWHLFARGHFIHHLIYAEMLEEALG